jgi:hypothetical protein
MLLHTIDRTVTLLETLCDEELMIIQATAEEKDNKALRDFEEDCRQLINSISRMDEDITPMQNVDYGMILNLVISKSKEIAITYATYIKDEPTLTKVLLSYAISNLRIQTVSELTFEESVEKYLPDYQYVKMGKYPTTVDGVINAARKVQKSSCTIC